MRNHALSSVSASPAAKGAKEAKGAKGAEAKGAKANGAEANGAKANGAKANGAKANGAKANVGRPPDGQAARAARIHQILDELYPSPAPPLVHETPYQLLVATLLSAQCTDARVNLVTPALFAVAPDAHAMARLSPPEVLKYVKTCGLANGKSKNIVAMSKALVANHGGDVPRDFVALEALAGVGHKTAGVVMAQAFGVAAFPVDTHIHRLAGRWGLSRARNVEEVERDLKALFPEERWNALHLQIIYFGRAHCPARGHDPEACPICSWTGMSSVSSPRRHKYL